MQRLTRRIEALRVRVETMQAQQAAAKATVVIGESASGLSKQMADAHAAMRRMEERTQRMQARAQAVTELAAGDGLTAELDQLATAAAIEAELAALKLQLSQGTPPRPQLSSGR
jgi:phage shock protein A